ncbi:hypothetical protein [Microbacterium faecale]|nr:hypothetical protein [Microbacterium faecale]
MTGFQKLVLATGLANTGWRMLRGRIPAEVESRTRLMLNGSALPGSLVLNMVPATSPADEILPDGQGEFFRDADDQDVDKAIDRALSILNRGKVLGPDSDDSGFAAALNTAGPRVASALRTFSTSLFSGGFEPDIVWHQPRVPVRRARLGLSHLEHINRFITTRRLVREPIALEGVLRTVSDKKPMLELETAPDEFERVDAKDIAAEVMSALHVGVRLRIHAEAVENVSPGGDTSFTYKATGVEVLS